MGKVQEGYGAVNKGGGEAAIIIIIPLELVPCGTTRPFDSETRRIGHHTLYTLHYKTRPNY